MTALYPFQQAAVDEIEAKIAEDHRKIILVAPTGSGKTVIAAAIIKRATERHRCILVLAHRREIITQAAMAFGLDGRSIGVFPCKDDTARALWRHACWISLGEAAARVAQNLS